MTSEKICSQENYIKFTSMHSHPIYYFRYPIKQVSLRITFDEASGNLQLLFGKKL
jgi:hypothetical protein